MAEYDLEFNVKYIICDFEINIMKSIDGLLKVRICGCFFYFRQCFQRRVNKRGLHTEYERNEILRKFVNECSALSFLPIEYIEKGLNHIEMKY